MDKEDLEELETYKEWLENRVGHKIPKGICICKIGPYRFGIVKTKDANELEADAFSTLVGLKVNTDIRRNNEIRKDCSGSYIKIGD